MPPDGYPAFLQYLQSGRVSAFSTLQSSGSYLRGLEDETPATRRRLGTPARAVGAPTEPLNSSLQDFRCTPQPANFQRLAETSEWLSANPGRCLWHARAALFHKRAGK